MSAVTPLKYDNSRLIPFNQTDYINVSNGGTGRTILPKNYSILGNGTDVVQIIKNNYDADIDPTPLDDYCKGYSISSKWLNKTTGTFFECVDASLKSAVWKSYSDNSDISINASDVMFDPTTTITSTNVQSAIEELDSNKLNIGDSVDTASHLETARTISLSGDASGSTSFDGSSDVSIDVTVADDSHNHIIDNVDGLQDALDNKQDILIFDDQPTQGSLNPVTSDGIYSALQSKVEPYIYIQDNASLIWGPIINPFNRPCSVEIIDSTGNEFEGDIIHNSTFTEITIILTTLMSGKAILI